MLLEMMKTSSYIRQLHFNRDFELEFSNMLLEMMENELSPKSKDDEDLFLY